MTPVISRTNEDMPKVSLEDDAYIHCTCFDNFFYAKVVLTHDLWIMLEYCPELSIFTGST